MKHILLTNDDGYSAKGIQTLYQILKMHNFKVTMVAPKSERSAQSHAMSFYQPVQVEQISEDIFSVTGTPADCVSIALTHTLKNKPPDLIVSGINHGFNVGIDVNYSGTVGAATEAALMGYKAIAVSMDSLCNAEQLLEGFKSTSQLIVQILQNIDKLEWPPLQVLNVNVPLNFKSIAIAQCGSESLYKPLVEEMPSQFQNQLKIYLIGGLSRFKPQDLSQDVSLVESGFATLSLITAKQSSTMGNSNLESLVGTLLNDKRT